MAGKKRKSFTALLEHDGTALNWVIARVPFDVGKAWQERRRMRVRGEIEGFAFRTSLFPDPRGSGRVLLVNKKMQSAAKAGPGARVRIWLEPDLEERPAIIPPELARQLKSDRRLQRWFDALSESMRREIGKWAGDAKGPDARRKRAEKIAERMMQAMEGELDPPPILRAAFLRQPPAREGWFALTPVQRRNHLLGIFYYETAEARERRAAKAIEAALRAARKRSGGARKLDFGEPD
ncbi:MAG TPA: YdeI/OmpD-associated family protein [Terracidiphilus sp.]|nr:YdeI/OmpD-associated family protein [Terracidiphilus sp.]